MGFEGVEGTYMPLIRIISCPIRHLLTISLPSCQTSFLPQLLNADRMKKNEREGKKTIVSSYEFGAWFLNRTKLCKSTFFQNYHKTYEVVADSLLSKSVTIKITS